MSTIAIIPARGQSKRIPRKNVKLFNGKPIIAYSIETAQKSGLFDRIIVSTEDAIIAEIASQYGAEILERPRELAEIDAPDCGTQEVVRHALMTLGIKDGYTCCMYATAPMLRPETLETAYWILSSAPIPYVVPVGTWLRDPGQFYFGQSHSFKNRTPLNTTGTRIIRIDPKTECDINEECDWKKAEQMYKELYAH